LEAVVHMGAISSTTEEDADLILAVNFTLSKHLWRWCAECGVRLVYASSAATYGDGSQGFEDRDDLPFLIGLRPLNAYGWSKALFDAYARRSADKGAAPPQWAGLKFFNVYGPNEYHKGAMRSVVAQVWPRAKSGASVALFRSHHPDYADGGQLRDFIYVKDVEAIVLWLLDRPDVSGVFNAGTGAARSFLDLAAAVFHAAAMSPAVAFVDTPEAIRDRYQYFTQADTRRLRRAGYARAFTSLEDGVADYVTRYLSADDPYR
jgi:ADP-L-glycero-D-manno-heptose 6-epimerase